MNANLKQFPLLIPVFIYLFKAKDSLRLIVVEKPIKEFKTKN